MKALIARKVGMTQIFGDKGKLIPVTLVQAEEAQVVGMRTLEKDGYSAAIIGYGKAKKPGKAVAGQTKQLKATPAHLKEFRLTETDLNNQEDHAEDEENTATESLKVGDTLAANMFKPGDEVTISGTSKGKGFAGTIKRYNFARGPKTHGSKSYRALGSIGSMYPQKVYKGRKMPGRMGAEQVTYKKVTVAEVDAEQNLLALKGAVPGSRNNTIVIVGV